jgi:uncharacterized membrane protein YdbT with pleckstrin-like domain
MSQTQSEPPAERSTEQSTDEEAELIRAHPTIRPTLIRLGVALVVGLGLFALLQAAPGLVGSADLTGTVALVVLLLTLLLTLRYLVRIVVLRRTTYLVTDRRVEREYSLLFRTRSKAVRFDKLRSHELTQGRIQALLGFGTVSINRGLGTIHLEDIDDAEGVYRTIQRCADGME